MTDVNDDAQRVMDDLRARSNDGPRARAVERATGTNEVTSEIFYLEYSIHRDVWYRLGGIGMTLYAYALEMLEAARKPNSEATKHIRKLYADVTDADVIHWRLTMQTTVTVVLNV